MFEVTATPLRKWINEHHNSIGAAAKALGVSRQTLHHAMRTGYVIDGRLYRPTKQ